MALPPTRRFKLTIDGNEFLVELAADSKPTVQVTVNGHTYEATIEPLPQAEPAPLEEAPARSYRPPPELAVDEVRAPIPGDILDIRVRPGDSVTEGQVLCSLEAMKMKSAIGAPCEAVIASVEVVEGQPVKHDDLLFTLERP